MSTGTDGGAPLPSIDDVRALGERLSNWGRWGDDDERGTLNHLTPQRVAAARDLVVTGETVSLAIPFGAGGPDWPTSTGRTNAMHFMTRDGSDAAAGVFTRDWHDGVERHFRVADDVVVMSLQSGTQWDALAHISFDGMMYNGVPVTEVSSAGARRNGIMAATTSLVGPAVLLDLPRHRGVDHLQPGDRIGADELDDCARRQRVRIHPGDIVLLRTGHMVPVRCEGDWRDYILGPAPGITLGAVPWLHDHDVAAIAADTCGVEVFPNDAAGAYLPVHIALLVYLGMMLGEIFDLEDLAERCAMSGRYRFMFSAAPLPFPAAVGSPVNPIALL